MLMCWQRVITINAKLTYNTCKATEPSKYIVYLIMQPQKDILMEGGQFSVAVSLIKGNRRQVISKVLYYNC